MPNTAVKVIAGPTSSSQELYGGAEGAPPGQWINYAVRAQDFQAQPVPGARVCYWIKASVLTGHTGIKGAVKADSTGHAYISLYSSKEGYDKVIFWPDEVNTTLDSTDVPGSDTHYAHWVKWTPATNSIYYTFFNYVNDWRRIHAKSKLTYSTIGDDGCIAHAKEMGDKKAPYKTTTKHNGWQAELVGWTHNGGVFPYNMFRSYLANATYNSIMLGSYTHCATGWKAGIYKWSVGTIVFEENAYFNCTIFRNAQFTTNNTITPSY